MTPHPDIKPEAGRTGQYDDSCQGWLGTGLISVRLFQRRGVPFALGGQGVAACASASAACP